MLEFSFTKIRIKFVNGTVSVSYELCYVEGEKKTKTPSHAELSNT